MYNFVPSISVQSDRDLKFRIINPPNARARDEADLRLLRTLLERWAEAEEERIRTRVPVSKAAEERAEKLRREIEYLRAIENTRSEAARRRTELARAKFLNELAKPVDLEGEPCNFKKNTIWGFI